MLTKNLKQQQLVITSEREVGFVYEFRKRREPHYDCLSKFIYVAETRKMKTQIRTNDFCCTPAKKEECKCTALLQSWLCCIRASTLHVVALLRCHRILRPKLYTLHGSYRGESVVLAWALLQNKTKATYIEMFTSIRSAIVERHGDIGRIHGFITDKSVINPRIYN